MKNQTFWDTFCLFPWHFGLIWTRAPCQLGCQLGWQVPKTAMASLTAAIQESLESILLPTAGGSREVLFSLDPQAIDTEYWKILITSNILKPLWFGEHLSICGRSSNSGHSTSKNHGFFDSWWLNLVCILHLAAQDYPIQTSPSISIHFLRGESYRSVSWCL